MRSWILPALLFAAALPAQQQFGFLNKESFPKVDGHACAYGDLNGDGSPDLVMITGNNDKAQIFTNDGKGNYTAARLPVFFSRFHWPTAIALGDVDGDGDLDIALGSTSFTSTPGQTQLMLNRGNGVFDNGTSRLPADAPETGAIQLVDVDADRDLDLVLGKTGSGGSAQTRLFLNDGRGNFQDATAVRLPKDQDETRSMAVADIDRDGDPDLVLGNGRVGGQRNRVYVNDGKGKFTDDTNARLNQTASTTKTVLFADLDGDRDVDLVESDDTASGSSVRWYANNGRGVFGNATALASPSAFPGTLATGDFDADGDLDLFIGASGTSVLLQNSGRATFTDVSDRIGSRSGRGACAAFVDVDADRDLDLVLPSETLFFNRGNGQFADARAGLFPESFSLGGYATFGDFDGDGDPDAITALGYMRNDGSGRYVRVRGVLPASIARASRVESADCDGDGDLDLVITTGGPTGLLLNDGTGRFTDASARMPTIAQSTTAVAAVDVDGDRDTDLIFANRGQNRIFINQGNARFVDRTTALFPRDSDPTNGVVAADIDGDRDLDLVFANGDTFLLGTRLQNTVYVNDGKGTFTNESASRLPRLLDLTLGVDAADLDRDGDVDLVFANSGTAIAAPDPTRIYRNNGRGIFVDASASLPRYSHKSANVRIADFDLNGHADLVLIGVPFGGGPLLLLGDGRGGFRNESRRIHSLLGIAYDRSLAVVDTDRDGDVDLFAHGKLFVNRHRQLFGRSVARLGRPFELDVYIEPGYGSGAAVPFVGLQALAKPIAIPPLGLLHIDPAQIVMLPGVVVPGTKRVTLTLPATASLAGRPLLWQALMVGSGSALRLSSLTSDILFR